MKEITTLYIEKILENEIKTNIREIIPSGKILAIKVSCYRSKFHLGTRKLFRVVVKYATNGSSKNKILLVKQVYDAFKSFNLHDFVYNGFENIAVPQLFPKVYFIIPEGNYIVMDYIKGKSLYNLIASRITVGCWRFLLEIFENIGNNLYFFHSLTENQYQPIKLCNVVEKIRMELDNSKLFIREEKNRINNYLKIGEESLDADYTIPAAKGFNDWTVRNFILEKKGGLKLIDVDYIIHPEYPEYDIIWNDISSFLINIEGKIKYSPLITEKKINQLERAFLNGYNNMLKRRYSTKEIHFLYYISVLRFFLGMIERPLHAIYQRWPGVRFIKKLRKSLINGSGSLFSHL